MRFSKLSMTIIVSLVLIMATALSGCTTGSNSGTTTSGTDALKAGLPDTMDFNIQVIGGTTSPVTVTYADMKAMEFKDLSGISTVNSVGTVTVGDYAGVPMMSVIDKAGLPEGDISFKVAAADGYNIVYTREQMEKSILAFKKNGTALKPEINAGKNAICMVVPGETNNMWTKMPAKIEIIKGTLAAPVLTITGMTENKKYLSLDDLKAMAQVNSTYVDKSNNTVEITGVSLNALLDSAAIQSGATEAVFTATDGYNKTISLTDIKADKNAVIVIGNDGSLKNYVANQPSNTRVSNLSTIKIV